MAERRARLAVGLLAGAALLAALALVLLRLGSAPEGPVDVPLDAAACARCRMLVSDPSFAAQLHTRAGEVRFFDDPGCLLLHLREHADDARAAWVHHLRAPRWLPMEEALFVPVPRSPMGHGLGAVSAGEAPRGLTAQEAGARLVARERARRGTGHAAPAAEDPR